MFRNIISVIFILIGIGVTYPDLTFVLMGAGVFIFP